MVRPDRFELPTFWFVARNRRIFIDLALGTTVAKSCSLLRVIKHLDALSEWKLAKSGNRSMQGMGTKVGTVPWQ